MPMGALRTVVARVDDIDALVPMVRALGVRHAAYGVRDEHYDVVGETLLWTLAKGLRGAFTDEVAAAWTAAYGLLAGAMQDAARVAELPQAA